MTKEHDAIDLKGNAGKGNERVLGVSRYGQALIFKPSWACAEGQRSFERRALEVLLEAIEYTGQFDSWYAATDARGRPYAVKLVDGRLYCDEMPRDDDEDGKPSAPNFSWTQFARAVKARAKDLLPEQA